VKYCGGGFGSIPRLDVTTLWKDRKDLTKVVW
jgi:hypothetical protein